MFDQCEILLLENVIFLSIKFVERQNPIVGKDKGIVHRCFLDLKLSM